MNHNCGRRGLLFVILALIVLATSSTMAGQTMNTDADEIVRSMSSFLASTKAFSVAVDISNEIITKGGEKLQFNSSGTLLLQRPARFHIDRQSRFGDVEMFFDGKTVTIYGKNLKSYFQQDVVGTTDDAFSVIGGSIGVVLPATDLLVADPYAALTEEVTSSGYYGTDYVQGVECHHLGFRAEKVDWQLWIRTGGEPLPMKFVITTKWMTGAPQYSVQLNNWNLKPVIAADRFTFVAPAGTEKLQNLPVDEAGEIVERKEVK
ncbi:MAG TPA: DUF2092 domain-containing protein [Candidatus Sulfotelmatobacter sp.]|nr:DUF2092 domain-containing protein [Candidatus Sulfotelmatobacter sp.]